MATPYTVEVKVAGTSGWNYVYHFTASDVAAEAWLGNDGSGDLILPANKGALAIVDIIVSSAGGTTKNAELFLNGVSTGQNISLAANVGTVYNRQFQGSPIPLPIAGKFKVLQRA